MGFCRVGDYRSRSRARGEKGHAPKAEYRLGLHIDKATDSATVLVMKYGIRTRCRVLREQLEQMRVSDLQNKVVAHVFIHKLESRCVVIRTSLGSIAAADIKNDVSSAAV